MKHWKPIFIENSKIPKWLSYLAPIDITAITLGFIVLSVGEMSEVTKRHETIHFQQFLETGFVGFLLIYLWDWLKGLFFHWNGTKAYLSIRAEQEAYLKQGQTNYLEVRKRWVWLRLSVRKPPYINFHKD